MPAPIIAAAAGTVGRSLAAQGAKTAVAQGTKTAAQTEAKQVAGNAAKNAGGGGHLQKPDTQGGERAPQHQQKPSQGSQPQAREAKIGILVMLWCLFWAAIHDIVGLVLIFFLLDDIGIADIIYGTLVTFPLIAYCWCKGIKRNAWFLMGWLFEFIPYLAVLLPQTLYLLIIFWITNSKSKKAQKLRMAASMVPTKGK